MRLSAPDTTAAVLLFSIEDALLVGYLRLCSALFLRPFLGYRVDGADKGAFRLVFHHGIDLIVHVLSLIVVVLDRIRSTLGEPLIVPHILNTVLGERVVYRLPDSFRNIAGNVLCTRCDYPVCVLSEKPVLCKLLYLPLADFVQLVVVVQGYLSGYLHKQAFLNAHVCVGDGSG